MKKILLLLFSMVCTYSYSQSLIEEYLNLCTSLEESIEIIDIIKKKHKFDKIPYGTPVKSQYRISSGYGYRIHPISKKKTFHGGIDFAMSLASRIYATADGKVIYADKKGGYGKCVIIQHSYGFSSLYGHLSGYYVLQGDEVKKGKIIGFVGSTGLSTGNHLHYQIMKNNKTVKPYFYYE